MRQVLSRQVLGKGVLTAAAASSLLSIATGAAYAHPGAMAEASHSPGALSGNSVSVPITLSPNVCGNSVDGGAALNPSMGNTCATTTGSDAHHAGRDYERYLSPEHAEAFERYLEEHQGGRHALPEQRHEEPRHEEARRHAPRHAAPRYEEGRDEGGYGGSGEEEDRSHGVPAGHGGHPGQGGYGGPDEEECDDHPHALPAPAPVAHHAPPAPERPQLRPHPKPQPAPHPKPAAEHPAPRPAPQPHPAPKPLPHPAPKPPVHEAPVEVPAPPQPAPVPAPVPLPAPVNEAPVPLPAPAPGPAPVAEAPRPLPAPAPVAEEAPVPAPPHGSRFVEHPAPAPAPEVVRPADQPPAAPAGDTPIHLAPAPAPAPVPVTPAAPVPVPAPLPAPAQVSAPELAETGAGQPGAAAALASALILGGAILYRRSRTA
ncbi:chaplin family protein [Streptomyces sp. NPDC001903]|uniref:chaplin n=1 Tax=Streptomyces sp. NPDC001903 TaxID=3364622 RepID=UPI00369ABDB6